MGVNKRILSKNSIKYVAKNNDIESFINYFNSDIIMTNDSFSSYIYNKIINDDNIFTIFKYCNEN
jgi:hypothetical protein